MTDEKKTMLLTPREAADEYRVCEKTISRMVARGDLKGVRIGRSLRIARSELERFVQGVQR